MRRLRTLPLIPLLFFSSIAPSMAGLNPCTRFLMQNAAIDMKVVETNGKLSLSVFKPDHWVGRWLNRIAGVFKNPLRLDDLARAIYRLDRNLDASKPYFSQVADAFYLNPRFHGENLSTLPKSGPTIFYLNHPLSGADAFAVMVEIEKIRPDAKVIAANYLESLPGFKEHAFIVNVLKTPEAKATNRAVLAEVNAHIKNGGALVIFPAGSVSVRAKGVKSGYPFDPEWKAGILRFGEQSPNTVFHPIFVGGQPSEQYLRLRDFSVGLSNAYVFRELANQIGTTIDFTLGKPISQKELLAIPEATRIETLRTRLYQLRKTR